MKADAWDGDWPITQGWLDHSLAAEPYDSRFPDYGHTHEGIDVGMPVGTGLYSVDAGTVGMVAWATLQLHLDSGVDVWMFHIDQALVNSGQRISKNQRVANSGNKVPGGGASTGPHLHYEIRPAGVPYNPTNNSLNPLDWVDFPSTPAPAPTNPGEFVCTITADGGAWAHSSPDVLTSSRVDIIDKGAAVTFNAWCHAGPTVAAIPDARTGQTGDDRMFRSSIRGLWIASSMVLGVPAGDTPQLPDYPPAPPVPTPSPSPVPVPGPTPIPFTGDIHTLEGKSVWEFTDAADYQKLKFLGFDSVLIRAYNGSGGPTADQQQATWKDHSAKAHLAGLRPIPWTYWYGPGEPGYTETDPAAYLMECAKATVALKMDATAIVVDAEAHSLDGLGPALKYLRDQSGFAVFLCPPGDPNEFGYKVDWPTLDKAVDGYVPQVYTGAWGSTISLDHALAEWTPTPPLFPAGDEQDAGRALAFVASLKSKGYKGWSYWRYGVGTDATLAAYGDTPYPPVPTPNPVPVPTPNPNPTPTPEPNPSPAPLSAFQQFIAFILEWLQKWGIVAKS